jgi:hypothetical protein
MKLKHEREIARAASTIHSIETGDVVGVEYFDPFNDGGEGSYEGEGIPILILQSELDRKVSKKRARANRTPGEIEADDAEWEEMVAEMMAELPPEEPELLIPNIPELPTNREPSTSEVAALSYAIEKHLRYLKVAGQIEAKRERDAATKVRTAARRQAEQANPEGTAKAKKAVMRSKAADRQRRFRDRKKNRKDTDA